MVLGVIHVHIGRLFLDTVKLQTLVFGLNKVFVISKGDMPLLDLNLEKIQKILQVSKELEKLEKIEEVSITNIMKEHYILFDYRRHVFSIDCNKITSVELKRQLIPYRIKLKIRTDDSEFEWTVDPLPGESGVFDRCFSILQSAFPDKLKVIK